MFPEGLRGEFFCLWDLSTMACEVVQPTRHHKADVLLNSPPNILAIF